MNNRHITELLENGRVDRLSSGDQAVVNSHIADCAECRLAFHAALASSVLIKARIAERVEPPQFFSTRIMAAVRERRREGETVSLWGLWQAARGLITGMAAVVLILGGFTIADIFSPQESVNPAVASVGSYSAERVLFQDGYQNVSYDPLNVQVDQTVLGPEDVDAEY